MERWAAGTPPGRSGGTNAGHRSRCPTAVLVTTPLGNRVLSLPALQLRNPSLISSHRETLLNLIVLLRSQGLGGLTTRIPDTGLLGSTPKFTFPSLTPLPWIQPQRQDSKESFREMTPLRERVEAVTGLRATGERGCLLPLPTRRAAGVSTADSASLRQPLGGQLQGCGGRLWSARRLAALRPVPQILPVFLLPSICPLSRGRCGRRSRVLTGWRRCGTGTEEESGAERGLRATRARDAQARRGLLSPPQFTNPSSPG